MLGPEDFDRLRQLANHYCGTCARQVSAARFDGREDRGTRIVVACYQCKRTEVGVISDLDAEDRGRWFHLLDETAGQPIESRFTRKLREEIEAERARRKAQGAG